MIPCSTKAQQKSTHTLKHTTGTPNKAGTSAAGTGGSRGTHRTALMSALRHWDVGTQPPNVPMDAYTAPFCKSKASACRNNQTNSYKCLRCDGKPS